MLSRADIAAIFRKLADEIEGADRPPEPEVIPEPPKPVIDLSTVLGIQQAFNAVRAANYPKLVEDGVHGPVMAWALKELQAAIGIPVTGEADEATVQTLHKALFGA